MPEGWTASTAVAVGEISSHCAAAAFSPSGCLHWCLAAVTNGITLVATCAAGNFTGGWPAAGGAACASLLGECVWGEE